MVRHSRATVDPDRRRLSAPQQRFPPNQELQDLQVNQARLIPQRLASNPGSGTSVLPANRHILTCENGVWGRIGGSLQESASSRALRFETDGGGISGSKGDHSSGRDTSSRSARVVLQPPAERPRAVGTSRRARPPNAPAALARLELRASPAIPPPISRRPPGADERGRGISRPARAERRQLLARRAAPGHRGHRPLGGE